MPSSRPSRIATGVGARCDEAVREATAAGPPKAVAEVMRGYEAIGIAEVMWTFRSPFDIETMQRLPEMRSLLAPG